MFVRLLDVSDSGVERVIHIQTAVEAAMDRGCMYGAVCMGLCVWGVVVCVYGLRGQKLCGICWNRKPTSVVQLGCKTSELVIWPSRFIWSTREYPA